MKLTAIERKVRDGTAPYISSDEKLAADCIAWVRENAVGCMEWSLPDQGFRKETEDLAARIEAASSEGSA